MFDWSDYLDLARSLSGSQGQKVNIQLDEAAARSAISRAYYAAFCHARNYAQQYLQYVPHNAPGDHGAVRQHYRHCGMVGIADSLDRLRGWRNFCDYRDSVTGLRTMVRQALIDANSVLSQL